MAEHVNSSELRELWRVFLTKNLDARLIVHGTMVRMGLSEDEVLFVLIDAWMAQQLTQEQPREFYEAACQTTVN